MAFEDWFIARARVSSKPHKKVTMDDKMTFFQQLSTLISSGTPLLQAINISAEQSQSTKMRQVLEEVSGRVAAGSALDRKSTRLNSSHSRASRMPSSA